jgi:hypothetical protein
MLFQPRNAVESSSSSTYLSFLEKYKKLRTNDKQAASPVLFQTRYSGKTGVSRIAGRKSPVKEPSP